VKRKYYVSRRKKGSRYIFLYRLNKESCAVLEDERTFHVVPVPEGQERPTSRPQAVKYVEQLIETKKRELEKAAAAEKRKGTSHQTVGEYAALFYDSTTCPHIARVRPGRINPKTQRHQRANIHNHILTDPIAGIPLDEVVPADVGACRQRLLEKGLAEGTVFQCMNALRVVFREARINRLIDFDPASAVSRMKPKPLERGIFTEEELKRLIHAPVEPDAQMAFTLAAATGLRMSECLALRYRNIHDDWIDVVEAWKDTDVLGPPKWEKPRQLPIPIFLQAMIKVYAEDRIRTHPTDLLICEDFAGIRRGPTWWRKAFTRTLKAAGIPRKDSEGRTRTPHSLRHTLNSMLIEKGCNPIKVQFFFGWSFNIPVPVLSGVQRGYTHMGVEDLRELVPVIEAIFS
jgi:integrase